MKKREKLIDAMAEIDEDLLVAHAQIKKPTRMQRFRKYAGAAMIYVAACLVVALLLPFIIGKGEDPKPNPGVDPIVTETHSPVTDDPEAKKISAADIYEAYFDVDPEKLSEPVTLDEVKNIITAAEQAYAEYDLIILQDETVVETTPKKPDVKFSDLKDYIDARDESSKAVQLVKYISQVHSVICDVLEARAPETSKMKLIEYGGGITGIPEFDNEYVDYAYHLYGEDGIVETLNDYCMYSVVYKETVRSSNDGYTILFPSGKDYDIFREVYYKRNDLPMQTTEFDGLELTIMLDGIVAVYDEGDGITATVILENARDSDVTLYQGYLGDFLDEVQFLENGEYKPYYKEQRAFDEAIQTTVLKPGEYIIHKETFSPFKPYYNPDEIASMDSLWEIEASVAYVPYSPTADPHSVIVFDFEDIKTGTVRINVPHDRDNDAVTPPDSMTIGYNGKTDSFTRDESYYPYELLYRRVNKALTEIDDTIQVYCEVDIDSIRENTPYAEFVYNTATTVRMRDSVTDYSWNTEPVSRICFTKIVDDFVMILSRDEAYTDIYGVYANKNFEDVFDGVQRIAEEYVPETTTTAPPPETTTTTVPPETTTTKAPVVKPIVPETPAVTTAISEEETVTYTDPYISNKTDRSITKTLYGCEYTVTLDKSKYEQGDLVTVVVTLENKGKDVIDFRYHNWRDNFLDDVIFLVNGKGDPNYWELPSTSQFHLAPGKTLKYTAKYDTTYVKITEEWSIRSNIEFYIGGRKYNDSIEIEVPHDGIDENAFSPIGTINPFWGTGYTREFSGDGCIQVTLNHIASVPWREYTAKDFPGLDIEKTETTEFPDYMLEDLYKEPEYRNKVKIYLKDKSDVAVVEAVELLYELDKKKDFIYSAGPSILVMYPVFSE